MEWAKKHCLTEQIVYLARSSAVKVGITRVSQMPTRWIDQGATDGDCLRSRSQSLHGGPR